MRKLPLLLLLFVPLVSFSQINEHSKVDLFHEALGAIPDWEENLDEPETESQSDTLPEESYFTEQEILALNKEYAHLLSIERSKVTGTNAKVVVDRGLVPETIIFFFTIVFEDTAIEERLGVKIPPKQVKDLKRIAWETFESFKGSPSRHEIQMSEDLVYVWVEFSETSSIVNFSRTPSTSEMK